MKKMKDTAKNVDTAIEKQYYRMNMNILAYDVDIT